MTTTYFRSAPHWKLETQLFEVKIGRSEKHVHTVPLLDQLLHVGNNMDATLAIPKPAYN